MIKPAKLDQENFIVLIPDSTEIESLNIFRDLISEHYNLYNNNLSPQLHLTIDRIRKDKSELAVKKLQPIIKNTAPFKISISSIECIEVNDMFLTVKVETTKELLNFAQKVHSTLTENDISTIENYEDWKFHITLINNNFTENPIPLAEFATICNMMDKRPTPNKTTIKRLEIWQANVKPESKTFATLNFK